MPKFSGEYSQWSHFRDLFTSIIKDNSDILAVEKLHYLKMSLIGEPAQHLKNVTISGDNFQLAWDLLVERYEHKRILIDAQVAALYAPRKIKIESAAALKQLLADVKEALGALKALDCPVDQWDILLVYMLARKLDSESLKRWEEKLGPLTTTPSFKDFESFFISRIYTLEAIERSQSQNQKLTSSRASSAAKSFVAATSEQKCALCGLGHYISSCSKYREKPVDQRREIIKSKNLCFNCLGPHQLKTCRNAKRCRLCQKQHHTTLHPSVSSSSSTPVSTAASPTSTNQASANISSSSNEAVASLNTEGSQASSHVAQSQTLRRSSIFLATAMVNVLSRYGEPLQYRALLDQGSEVSFISEAAAQTLQLSRRSAAIPIIGIGAQRHSVSNGLVHLIIMPRANSSIELTVEALVLPKLTAYLPAAQIEYTHWSHIQGLHLADPRFARLGKIDLILGAKVYAEILEEGLRRGQIGSSIAQKTSLGWVLSGMLTNNNLASECSPVTGLQCSLDKELLDSLQRFWSQEEIAPHTQISFTVEEEQCERHFTDTHTRNSQGRFIVRLPFKAQVNNFGDSRSAALSSLRRMEKRFESDANLKSAYSDFLREYRDLDHMRPVNSRLVSSQCEFFLPHHGVLRETSSTTNLRVVFNGSQKTNLGFSLNDALHTGPKLQTEITDILLRWRRHQYVFAADIEKMYRQIHVHEDD